MGAPEPNEIECFFFPALSDFIVLGSLMTTCLYEQSRRPGTGESIPWRW
ncbi:hypothetical protein [Roseitranquillus sediminis]|nr:hypothetical protein [Roseitranquillus sediminis]MBM9593036.1 hypothetical protein [Roseitranquillus sediminis]